MEWYTTCLCSFSPYTAQKSKFPNLLFFFDTVTTHNDQPSYVKHVLGSISVFFTRGGGGRKIRGISVFSYPSPPGEMIPINVTEVCIAQSRFSARWTCRRQWNLLRFISLDMSGQVLRCMFHSSYEAFHIYWRHAKHVTVLHHATNLPFYCCMMSNVKHPTMTPT